MATDTGIDEDTISDGQSIFDDLSSKWLDYYKIKSATDLETRKSDKNVPDRMDLAAGIRPASAASPLTGNNTMLYIGIALVLAIGIGFFVKRA